MGVFRYQWFDVIFVLTVVSGLLYGRKRGLSVELVPLAGWITLVVVGGTFAEPLGGRIAALIEIQPNAAFVLVYLILAAVIAYIFSQVKNTIAKGLPGSDCFGTAEFPLGAAAGALRFVCILFVGLSLLSAQYIPEEDLAEPVYAYLKEEEKGPRPADFHRSIFVRSWSGRWLKYAFGQWLITAQPPADYGPVIVEGYTKEMERAIEGEKPK